MSLYKARDWWTATCGSDEEFEARSVVIGAIEDAANTILTGSLQGILRIYQPRQQGFSIEDLLIECQLQAPILQLELGTFTAVGGHQLAVLHPRTLVIYSISSLSGGQGVAAVQLNKIWEQVLERSAANMVSGSFAGSTDVLQICIQSMDGQLSFYERERLAFSRFLPQFLLPGPLCYYEPMSYLITCSSAFEVECYKYQTLAAAQAAAEKTTGVDPAGKGKKLHTEWKWVFGEMAWDIQIGSFTGEGADIILLGEHSLVVLDTQGQLRLQKRFDYQPVAVTSYPVSGNKNHLLVAAATGQMMVYSSDRLVWAAKGNICPIAIRVAAFGGQPGLLLTLDDEGKLQLSYMGTDPPVNAVDISHTAEVDYAALDSEYRELAAQIKAVGVTPVTPAVQDQLVITAQVPQLLDKAEHLPQDMLSGGPARVLTLQIYLRCSGTVPLTDVTLTMEAPAGLHLSQNCIVVPTVDQADGSAVSVQLQAIGNGVPADNMLSAVATYATCSGEPRTASLQVALPMCLFCQIVTPQQTATYKLTLDTNRPPPQLADLFQDMVAQAQLQFRQQGQSSNVMSFRYEQGPVVTILVSKSAGRYRVQSDSFEAMWLIVQELCQRLQSFFSNAEAQQGESPHADPFAISYKEAIPLEEMYSSIDRHWQAQQAVRATEAALADRAQQHRAVQKRLLMRFKDRQPSSVAHLDLLLAETFQELLALGAQQEEQQAYVEAAGRQLSATVQLILQLVQHGFGMSADDMAILTKHLSPQVSQCGAFGWEELTEASVTYLLSNQLAQSQQEKSVRLLPLARLCDTQILKKHISILLERLSQGAVLSGLMGKY